MRTQLKYVIIPTTTVTVSFIHEGYHYNLKHNLFARKHPFSIPHPAPENQPVQPPPHFVKMYDCQRRFLYLIIIIYLIIYKHKSDIYKRKKGRRHLHRRHNESPGRQGCGQTGGSQGVEGRGAVGGEYCKKQGGCVGFSDFMFTFARYRGGSGSCQRHLQERGGTDGGGQTTLQAAGTMHQGRWGYAPWRLGLCTRSPGLCARSLGLCAMAAGTMHQVAWSKNKGQKIYI